MLINEGVVLVNKARENNNCNWYWPWNWIDGTTVFWVLWQGTDHFKSHTHSKKIIRTQWTEIFLKLIKIFISPLESLSKNDESRDESQRKKSLESINFFLSPFNFSRFHNKFLWVPKIVRDSQFLFCESITPRVFHRFFQ